MCCSLCANYSKKCHSLIAVRLHPVAETLIPAPHYHLCRGPDQACNFQCKVCGRLIRETSHLPANQSLFGCCHRCAEYVQCDFIEKHRKCALRETSQAQPIHGAHPAHDAAPAAEPAAPAADAAHAPGRLRILLADDNATFLDSAVEFLAHDPALEVFGATDGTQALQIMNHFRPTLAVLDIVMPGVNGFDVCRTIRQSAQTKETRVVLLTAYASQSMAEQAKSCGADLCLAKPIQLQVLKDRILSLARASAAAAAAAAASLAATVVQEAESAATATVRKTEPSPASEKRTIGPGTRAPDAPARLPIRLLIVDDDASFLDGLVEFFQGSPQVFDVRAAKNGSDALKLFSTFKPHVVILDLFLPEVSGFKVCQAIRHSELSPATRILAVTGAASATAFQTAKLSGADSCLSKPVHLDRLRDEALRLAQEAVSR